MARRKVFPPPPREPVETPWPHPWPNGSGVFTAPRQGGRMELGRSYVESGRWRVWQKTEHGYADLGTAECHLDSLDMLPLPAELPVSRQLGSEASVAKAQRKR